MELENECVGMGTEGLIELGRARESDSDLHPFTEMLQKE
jgi:hypothetical protein